MDERGIFAASPTSRHSVEGVEGLPYKVASGATDRSYLWLAGATAQAEGVSSSDIMIPLSGGFKQSIITS